MSKLQEFDNVIQCYDVVLQISPRYLSVLVNKISSFHKQGNFEIYVWVNKTPHLWNLKQYYKIIPYPIISNSILAWPWLRFIESESCKRWLFCFLLFLFLLWFLGNNGLLALGDLHNFVYLLKKAIGGRNSGTYNYFVILSL